MKVNDFVTCGKHVYVVYCILSERVIVYPVGRKDYLMKFYKEDLKIQK